MRSLFKKYLKSTSGAIAVETALVTPILILIFLPSVDLGLKVHTLQKMNQAADSGIEYVVNGGRNEATLRNIMKDSYGRNIAQSDLSITATCGCIVEGSSGGNTENGEEGSERPADQFAGFYIKTPTTLSEEMCSAICDNGKMASELVEVSFSQGIDGVWKSQVINTQMQTRIK